MATVLPLIASRSLERSVVRDHVSQKAARLGLPFDVAAYLWCIKLQIIREEFCLKAEKGNAS